MASEFIGQLTSRAVSPFLKRYALSFLHEKKIQQKQEQLLQKKFRKIQYTSIGKKIGVRLKSSIEKLPLTSYEFYKQYFDHPNEGDLMFPLDDYVKAMTSGSMGKPKTYLLPKTGIWDNLSKTGLSFMFLSTHDGEKITFEFGDTIYRNAPGGSYISGFLAETFQERRSNWVKQVPKLDLSYHEKVDYFVTNYRNIDIAYMTVTSLLDDIYPRIGKPFKLKGFITQDRSASVLKEKIKEVAGTYPKVTYGSTETFLSGISSIEFPGCFYLDWRIMYCEFIPEEKAVDVEGVLVEEPPETVPLMEVVAGKRYQLITTPFMNDLTRYITPDIFECVSNGDSVLGTELPIFSFYTRKDKLISLHNFTRISEEELLNVLRDADIPFTDFTTKVELSGAKEYLAIFLELSSHMDVSEVTRRLNDELLKVDKDWRDLTTFMRYMPLKVHLLPNGAFSRYLGKKDGLPRIERIGMRDERLKVLLNMT
jgi:hypothetical protein